MSRVPNALEQLRARLSVGTVLTVVENTKRPEVQGHTRTLTFAGRTVVHGFASDARATPFRIGLPSRVRDVVWLGPDTVRLPLPGDNTVTYRITDPCARCHGPIADPQNVPADASAVCCRCGDPDACCPSPQPGDAPAGAPPDAAAAGARR